MPGSYDRFAYFLGRQKSPKLCIRFSEIEKVCGRKLPDSAYKHRAWWSNSPSHPLMKRVLAASWFLYGLDWASQTVWLRRGNASQVTRFKHMPGSYDRFAYFLGRQKSPKLCIRFSEIEKVCGRKLPDSAYKHRAWWSNSPSHPLMKRVLAASWRLYGLDWASQTVWLRRGNAPRRHGTKQDEVL